MSLAKLTDRLTTLLGVDVAVTFDDGEAPSQIRLYRPDPISESLVLSAVDRAREEFPEEMKAVSAVFVSFEDDLGPTRRRVTLA